MVALKYIQYEDVYMCGQEHVKSLVGYIALGCVCVCVSLILDSPVRLQTYSITSPISL